DIQRVWELHPVSVLILVPWPLDYLKVYSVVLSLCHRVIGSSFEAYDPATRNAHCFDKAFLAKEHIPLTTVLGINLLYHPQFTWSGTVIARSSLAASVVISLLIKIHCISRYFLHR